MNPYTAKLFADTGDLAVVFLLSLLTVTLGAYTAKYLSALNHSEAYLRGAAKGLLLLNSAVLTMEILGLVGFALRVKSGLWEFWGLFFLMGVIGVFKIFPVIGIGLFAWWKVGRRRFSYSTPILPIVAKYFALNAFCAGLYFLDEWMTITR
jgi:hypothetical protein